jgi:hypothetical protein
VKHQTSLEEEGRQAEIHGSLASAVVQSVLLETENGFWRDFGQRIFSPK